MNRQNKFEYGLITFLIIFLPIGILWKFITAYIIAGLIIAILLYIYIIKLACKIRFKKKYNIKHLPNGTYISLTRKENSFTFEFPYWIYTNDPRNLVYQTSNTGIKYQESILYLDGFKLKCENVIDFFDLITILKNKGVKFKKNHLEEIKLDNYYQYDFDRIIKTFLNNKETNKNEFISFIADLLIANGLDTVKMGKELLDDCDLLYLSKDKEIGAIKCDMINSNNQTSISILQNFNDYANNINVKQKIYISTSFYTDEIKQFADNNNIKLIDLNDLTKMYNDVSILPINNELEFKDIRKYIPEDLIEKLKEQRKLKI